MTSLTAQLCSPKQKAPFLLPVFRCDNQKCRSMFKKKRRSMDCQLQTTPKKSKTVTVGSALRKINKNDIQYVL